MMLLQLAGESFDEGTGLAFFGMHALGMLRSRADAACNVHLCKDSCALQVYRFKLPVVDKMTDASV